MGWLSGLLAIVLVAALTACATASSGVPTPGETTPPSSASPGPTSTNVGSPIPEQTSSNSSGATGSTPGVAATVPAGATNAVERARQALAGQVGVAPGAIDVVQVTPVDWPDSALGCPRPGILYSQVVTPGYRIILRAGGKSYEYHTDRGQRAVTCTSP